MKVISLLLSMLVVLQLQLPINGSDAAIDASGDPILLFEDEITPTSCHGELQPNDLLNGKLSSCDTFNIATLNSSPRRCLHIEAPLPQPSDNPTMIVCKDDPRDWFDGTNGCKAYANNEGWCNKFGHINYKHSPAVEACCACGGGKMSSPRLQVGDFVKVSGHLPPDCKSLKIIDLRTEPHFHYVLEVLKPCGPKRMSLDARGGVGHFKPSIEAGTHVTVAEDEPRVINKYIRVELKKCRSGTKEQEFTLTPIDKDNMNHNIVTIRHKLTGIDMASALDVDAKSPFFNITQSFEDGLFHGSDEFFFIKMISSTNEGRVHLGGKPRGATHSYLGSGEFGEKQYSEVQVISSRDFVEQEFSMWRFQPVLINEESDIEDDSAVVDEHSEWLIRMTQMIGIDYLTQLPPWHLLDVEREASKTEVKSRFRELSRKFHPDKLINNPEKKELYERMFVLLQNAYQGLKNADEEEKEKFRVQAESGSQLYAHSQYVVELMPFHWVKFNTSSDAEQTNESTSGRYILNAASHLDAALFNSDDISEQESEPTVQLWMIILYSARCGMSRSVSGMIDLAARHLEQHDNIKVGAYMCRPTRDSDTLGLNSDPICSQFNRRETPNVHIIAETIPGRKRDENGVLIEVPPEPELVMDNAMFKYFNSDVPHGNTTQFYPHNLIDFALKGKRIWNNNHLVNKMTTKDFSEPQFISNMSIVAYFDGTGNADTNSEVVDTISSSLPGVASRFRNDDVYVGIARCGIGDDNDKKHVDCSLLDVKWLPDIKVYGINETLGLSLLRGNFGDQRDVQIGLESMGNVLRMMLGGVDNDDEDDFEELEEDNDKGSEGGCDIKQPPPPPDDFDLDEIEGRMEDTPLLEMEDEDKELQEQPLLEDESKPMLEQSAKKPKLATDHGSPQVVGGRKTVQDRISSFQKRQMRNSGGGKLLGGGSSGSAGLLA